MHKRHTSQNIPIWEHKRSILAILGYLRLAFLKKERVVKRTFKFLSENSSLVVAIATVVLTIATLVLAVITALYLNETKLMRKIAYKSFLAEVSPKVFLEIPESILRLNSSKKAIEVTAIFKIKNVGKTEARDLIAMYTLSSGNAKIEGKIGPAPPLFPEQTFPHKTKMLTLNLNEENFVVVREAMKTKKRLIVPKDFAPPIFLDFNLRYFDQEGNEQSTPYRYKYKYIFYTNTWVFADEQ